MVIVCKSVLIRLTSESTISTYCSVREPDVLPGMFTIAPAQLFRSVLHLVMVEGLPAVPVKVAIVFSAKLKQALLESVTAKFVIVTTVPCPLP